MKLSYLVTCSTETQTLQNLFDRLLNVLGDSDELIIIIDEEAKNNDETKAIIQDLFDIHNAAYYGHKLNADYGSHKNFGNSKCTGDWIFQIDGDELPSENIIGENLHTIIDANPTMELFFVPRLNDFKGVTPDNARPWGWQLAPSPACGGRLIVNWPDYQGRIYKNAPNRIKWDRRLHEKIEGHLAFTTLPAEPEYALYHDKTIQKQLETNLRYNKLFTQAENQGHNVFK